MAEAHRRLGHAEEADRAWKASYRAARSAGDVGAMAWAVWSGGTLARQRGSLALARRLLALAAELGERGEARHTVWALEGIAQIHRNTGSYDTAFAMFEEAAVIAAQADDQCGRAWALRGMADIVSLRDKDVDRALALLSEAELACRRMKLTSALAYNLKMRGNVLFRAGRYVPAREYYETALAEFRAMSEPRGTALSRLGLAKTLARLGQDPELTAAELDDLRGELDRIGLRHAREMVDAAYEELGISRTGAHRAPAIPGARKAQEAVAAR